MAEAGKRRTLYYGLKLQPAEMAEVVARAVRGEDFDDLRALAQRGDKMVTSRIEDTDDWKKLRSK